MALARRGWSGTQWWWALAGNRDGLLRLCSYKPRRGVLYVGVTNDLARRIAEHRAKIVPGFTARYGVIVLVYAEEYSSILEARAREHSLKRWQRSWKFELIEKLNPDWRDLSEEL